jgi:hypothetical protein
MLKNSAVLDETQPAEPIKPELLAKLKREDMRVAVVERFRTTSDAPSKHRTIKAHTRSLHWRPADEEC